MNRTLLQGISARYALTLLVLTLSTLIAAGQNLKGRVTDARTGEPIIGAVVTVKSTAKAKVTAATDYDGNFLLPVKATPTSAVVSYTGYKDEEIDIYEVTDDVVEIALQENFNLLEGVVISVPYGQTRR